MATSADVGNPASPPNQKSDSGQPEQGFSSLNHDVIDKLENLELKLDENENVSTDDDGHKDSGSLDGSGLLPLRPYAGDCSYYIRTGSCKFGLNCRYNHPAKRAVSQAAKDLDKDVLPEESGLIDCKYYQTAEGCKYGKSCRYRHQGEESENIVPGLNFLGLPVRLGEKECPFYLRNGSCGYGSRCVFHHPDPTPMTGIGLPNSDVDDKFGRQVRHPLGKQNGASLPTHWSGASQSDQASWASHSLSDNTISYPNSSLSYVTLPSPSEQMRKQSEWNGYQPSNSQQSGHQRATSSADGFLQKTYTSMQDEEFPERPGQPECDYFMKTGNCKFRSMCWFHHPKDRKPKQDECLLSEKGLPLRPGKSICRHYERHGLCKFGHACLFDHPVSHVSPRQPDWHTTEATIGFDGGGWGD